MISINLLIALVIIIIIAVTFHHAKKIRLVDIPGDIFRWFMDLIRDIF